MDKVNDNWLDLSLLPTLQHGSRKRIDWKNSIGCLIPFCCDGIYGNINIVGYELKNKAQSTVFIMIDKYITEPYQIKTNSLTNCALKQFVSNRIADNRPEIVKYLSDPQDAYKYSVGSNKYIMTTCPICGRQSLKCVNDLCHNGFFCSYCSDGVSFPNKLMRSILNNLNINFICEVGRKNGFQWMKSYLYDFYININNQDILIEMDGGFHREINQYNRDVIKDNLAKENGFKLIRIDCKYDKNDAFGYIKNNIINSDLNKLLPLNNINWETCYKNSLDNSLTIACNLWENKKLTMHEIIEKINVSRTTTIKYLTKGRELGLCPSYNEDEARRRYNIFKMKPIAWVENGIIKNVFNNAKEAEQKSVYYFGVKCSCHNIQSVCNGTQKSHHGFEFKYITKEEYEQYKMIKNNNKNIEVVEEVDAI